MDSNFKYVSNFEVYCGKDPIVNKEVHVTWGGSHGEARLALNVVLHLLGANEGKGTLLLWIIFFQA